MLPLHKLESQGFLVLHRAVSIEAVNALRVIARRTPLPWADAERLPTRAITVSPAVGRLYAEIPPVLATVLSTMLQRYYRTFFPNAVVTWYFVKTRGGTPNQPIRRNFASADHPMDVSSVPGCLIIATTDDTRFVGFGWNHQVAFQSKKTEIKLQMGDMLFLRGDLSTLKRRATMCTRVHECATSG
ncbi:hypothetical protein PHYSODRAFT_295230 [Phytophthora sojae]|uniref:Uncharacterized protein n=1 Tax=Phytophthora sojae (strain P6497) TaxID=1094619 RepID=G4YQQ6_PHYSP|nr:hypothetical protein PHYSODRAFT_295230 [Phytophthora sojae]EGZ30427.1 hypothetical protein PHYSODRAFT_295230 [Phytophthora sojae]|eukprot:XP_009517702.1 hypothetical protein PHYSODRAFT_295230 [Phytophthora sojae]